MPAITQASLYMVKKTFLMFVPRKCTLEDLIAWSYNSADIACRKITDVLVENVQGND